MSYSKNGRKRSLGNTFEKVFIGKTTSPESEWKVITFSKLHEFSTQNHGKLNRNVFTEKLILDYPQLRDLKLLIEKVMIHEHFMGERTNPHLRTIIHCGNIVPHTLFQDLTFEQWDSLNDLPEHIVSV